MGQFKIFSSAHWLKSPILKSPDVKNNQDIQHQRFKNYRLENKLPQELGYEMCIIISKMSPFFKIIWEDQHQREFVTTIVQKYTIVYQLQWYKTRIEFLIVPRCHRLPHKNWVGYISFSSTAYILLQYYVSPETLKNARFWILMAVFPCRSKH